MCTTVFCDVLHLAALHRIKEALVLLLENAPPGYLVSSAHISPLLAFWMVIYRLHPIYVKCSTGRSRKLSVAVRQDVTGNLWVDNAEILRQERAEGKQ